MKSKVRNLITLSFLLVSFFAFVVTLGCNDDEPTSNYAKGKIIAVTGGCYLDVVLIEVENPMGIGNAGHFSTIGNEVDVTYSNAINVPYFSKIGIPDSVPQIVGTELYFECQEITADEEAESGFFTSSAMFCTTDHIPPSGAPFIITKVISFK